MQKELAIAKAAKNKNKQPAKNAKSTVKKPELTEVSEEIISQVITYPSKRIFTDKDNKQVLFELDETISSYNFENIKEHKRVLSNE